MFDISNMKNSGKDNELVPFITSAPTTYSLPPLGIQPHVGCTCGLIPPCSGRYRVKSLRSSFMGLYPQTPLPRILALPIRRWGLRVRTVGPPIWIKIRVINFAN